MKASLTCIMHKEFFSSTPFLTGSGTVRWQAERRAAMQTVLSYRAAKWPSDSDKPRCSLVWAGHETQDFINLFPEWINNTEVSRVNKEVIVRGMSLHIMT